MIKHTRQTIRRLLSEIRNLETREEIIYFHVAVDFLLAFGDQILRFGILELRNQVSQNDVTL